ncbi:MAG: TIGR01777 family oxidoreductase [Synechococcus sp.]
MRLLLLGCTGLVGRELVPTLLDAGHQLTLVSRRPRMAVPWANDRQLDWVQQDPAQASSWVQGGALQQALAAADGVVNLAGEPIAEQRWTPNHLRLLHDSRIATTGHLTAAMGALATPPSVLVNASAVGFYGTSETARFVESSEAGKDVLGSLCCQWEAAAGGRPPATRLVVVRIGIVLAPDGGALGKMLPVFRAGFGGPIGSGRQWMSWIHRTDLCTLIQTALTDSQWNGVVNGVAPQPVSMASFASTLGRCLGRPSLLPVPGPVLHLLLGDGARVVLDGQQVHSERLSQLGFSFRYPDVSEALAAATTTRSR